MAGAEEGKERESGGSVDVRRKGKDASEAEVNVPFYGAAILGENT